MPTRRIAELPQICRHPEHDPPRMQMLEPGLYEHTCPSCRSTQMFVVGYARQRAD